MLYTQAFSLRYAFIEFNSAKEADFALSTMNGFQFDSKHQFSINLFTDIEKFATLDESFVEPKAQEYRPKVATYVIQP